MTRLSRIDPSRSSCSNPSLRVFVPALGLAILSVGCASSQPTLEPQQIYRDAPGKSSGLIVETIAEGERVMLIKSPDDLERVCSPRESDEGLSFSQGFDVSVPTAAGAVGLGEQSGDDAIALGNPSDLVQLARELLFRACELTLNLDADAEQTVAIYDHFLASFERIATSLQPAAESEDDAEKDDGQESGDGEVTIE
ncbi:MAG: hypothetical protein MI919_05265 [Holophagales bacterium]|nr:hypothetical protein [Holophagales bacterium]